MNLITIAPTHRLSKEDRRCWLERASPEIRSVIANYEQHSYSPVECIGHFDHKSQLWITLERWVEYIDHPVWQRDIQRTKLLIDTNGRIIESKLQPLIRIKRDDADPPIEPDPTPDDGDGGGILVDPNEPLHKPRRRRSKVKLEPCKLGVTP
jgi:hypothetical protein